MIRFLMIAFFLMTLNVCAKNDTAHKRADTLENFFKKADTFLSMNVKDGEVPYKAIKQEPKKLKELVNIIGNISLEEAASDGKKAFYINAYNILTIHAIIKNGIPSSPMDVEGFFNTIKHKTAGKELSLDQIEKEILFPEFGDTRVHFAVVCAALGCPQIHPFAYQPEKLDKQLNQAVKETLNRDYFIRVDRHHKTVKISELFKWYKQDFLKESSSVLAYINQYRDKKIPSDYVVKYYKYDWSLNNQ